MKMQVYSSSEKSQKYNRKKCLEIVMNNLLNNLGNYRDIKTLRLVPDEKKVISMRYNTSSQKPRRLMRADLIFMIGVYASFPT